MLPMINVILLISKRTWLLTLRSAELISTWVSTVDDYTSVIVKMLPPPTPLLIAEAFTNQRT